MQHEGGLCFRKGETPDKQSDDLPLLRRATTFSLDRQTPKSEAIGSAMNEMSQSPAEKIISQTIERTVTRIQGKFLQRPNAKVEDFFSLGLAEIKQLWATDLQAVKELKGGQTLFSKPVLRSGMLLI